MEIVKIGTTVFLVNKAWKKHQRIGGKVIPAKVTGYENVEGEVLPILKAGSVEISATHNHIFTDLNDAVNAIRSKK
jgi:hypothetical protein